MTDEKTPKRTTARSKFALSQIDQLQKHTGWNASELSAKLGYHGGGTVAKWFEDGEAPNVAGLAAECLQRRLGPNSTPVSKPDEVWLVRVSPEDAAMVRMLLAKFKVTIKEV